MPLRAALEDTVYRGHDGIRQFARDIDESWSEANIEILELEVRGEQAVSLGRLRLEGRLPGALTEVTGAASGSVRNERLFRFAYHATVHDARRELGWDNRRQRGRATPLLGFQRAEAPTSLSEPTRACWRRLGVALMVSIHGAGKSVKIPAVPRPQKTRLQRVLWRIGNPLRMWPLRIGLPSPPYTRRNAIIVETIGRRSGKRRRLPVGFLEEDGKLIVVAEDGQAAAWVRNALAAHGRLRVFYLGRWRNARPRLQPGDPEAYLPRMNRAHAAFVRLESSVPELVEITRKTDRL